jgi:hypothetical protein
MKELTNRRCLACFGLPHKLFRTSPSLAEVMRPMANMTAALESHPPTALQYGPIETSLQPHPP